MATDDHPLTTVTRAAFDAEIRRRRGDAETEEARTKREAEASAVWGAYIDSVMTETVISVATQLSGGLEVRADLSNIDATHQFTLEFKRGTEIVGTLECDPDMMLDHEDAVRVALAPRIVALLARVK